MNKKEIVKKIEEAKKISKKRKFRQSFEICINFKNVDMSSTDKLNIHVKLPKGRGKDVEIGVFADGDLNLKAKKLSKYVLSRAEIEDYTKDRRKMKKFANSCYAFISQPDLMQIVGKSWGIVLAPRGKMPYIIPPNVDLKGFIEDIKNTVRIRSKKNPTVHVPVGTEDMKSEDLAENILAVINSIEKRIPIEKISSIYCKTTMGPAVKIK